MFILLQKRSHIVKILNGNHVFIKHKTCCHREKNTKRVINYRPAQTLLRNCRQGQKRIYDIEPHRAQVCNTGAQNAKFPHNE